MNVQLHRNAMPRAVIRQDEPLWLVRVLLRHWLLLIAAAATGFVAMIGVLMTVAPTYDVSAKILVRIGREMTAPPVLGIKDGSQVMPAQKRPEDLASEVEIFSDPRLIKRVVEHFGAEVFLAERAPTTLWQHVKAVPKAALRWAGDTVRETNVLLGLRPPTTPLERVTLAIASGLSVETARKSDVIEIKLGYPDRETGEALLAKFVEFGLESHLEAYRSAGSLAFFAAESEAMSANLKRAELRLLDLRSRQDAIWSGPERRSQLSRTESELQLQYAQALAESAQAAAEIGQATGALKDIPAEIQLSSVEARNRIGDDLRARLYQLRLDLVALRTRFTEGHPEIAELKRQIAALEGSVEGEPSRRLDGVSVGPNQQHAALARDIVAKQNQLAGQTARAAELSVQLGKLREQLAAAQATEVEIADAEREVARLRRSVELYEKGLQDARIADAMDAAQISNLKIIMPPTASLLPSAPSLRKYLIAGVVGGLALAIAFILAREFLLRQAATPLRGGPAGRADGSYPTDLGIPQRERGDRVGSDVG